MANAAAFPPVWPPIDILPGDTILAEHWAPLANTANICLAWAGTGPLIQQSWPAGAIRYTGVTLEDDDDIPIPMMRWRVPLVSDQHVTLDVEAIGEYIPGVSPGGAGRIILESANTGDVVTLDLLEGGGAVTDTLTIGPAVDRAGVDRFDEIWLYPRSTGGADHYAELTRLRVECPPLTTPLAATRIDDVCPLGAGFAAADHPLSTPIGHWLLDVLDVVRLRPRVWCLWSGVDPAYVAHLPAGAAALVAPAPRIGVRSTWASIEGHGLVAHARRNADAGADRILDLRPELPPSATAQWVSHHEPRDRIAVPVDTAGVSGRAAGGVNAFSIWTREDVVTAAGAAWESEDEL